MFTSKPQLWSETIAWWTSTILQPPRSISPATSPSPWNPTLATRFQLLRMLVLSSKLTCFSYLFMTAPAKKSSLKPLQVEQRETVEKLFEAEMDFGQTLTWCISEKKRLPRMKKYATRPSTCFAKGPAKISWIIWLLTVVHIPLSTSTWYLQKIPILLQNKSHGFAQQCAPSAPGDEGLWGRPRPAEGPGRVAGRGHDVWFSPEKGHPRDLILFMCFGIRSTSSPILYIKWIKFILILLSKGNSW